MLDNKKEIRVRFAPSPTGFLHIGGARTALFNWLFAKKYNGKLLVRIEDTDVIRSDSLMVKAIFDGLKWLGIDWDGDPVYQSERSDIYKNLCDRLIESDKAYYCYCPSQKKSQQHSGSSEIKRDKKYDGHCRFLSVEERQQLEEKGVAKVVRFKVEKGLTQFTDLIHGSLKVNNNEIDDFIILRSDGSVTYHLAVVADDIDMGITNVIRGDDHISNTSKQIMIYRALGIETPQFAHVPLILGEDKKRLSKRHGATSISEYREKGYLPEALFNYLSLLGWSPGDDRELMSKNELVESFSLAKVTAKNAVFDEKKLQWMNRHYINLKSSEEICSYLIDNFSSNSSVIFQEIEHDYLIKVIEILKPKVYRITDFIESGSYFFKDPVSYDEKAQKKYWKDNAVTELLQILHDELENLSDFTSEKIENTIRKLAEKLEISAAKIIHPARLAVTGFGVSPGLFETLEILGKHTVLRRVKKAIEYLGK